MKEEWGEPIESRAPISIDVDGCIVVGRYLGSVEFQQRDSDRKSNIHSVLVSSQAVIPNGDVLEPGNELRFWGSHDLDAKLRRVPMRTRVRIAYGGTEKLSGDREMKVFEVRTAKGSKQIEGGYDERNPPPPEEPS